MPQANSHPANQKSGRRDCETVREEVDRDSLGEIEQRGHGAPCAPNHMVHIAGSDVPFSVFPDIDPRPQV